MKVDKLKKDLLELNESYKNDNRFDHYMLDVNRLFNDFTECSEDIDKQYLLLEELLYCGDLVVMKEF